MKNQNNTTRCLTTLLLLVLSLRSALGWSSSCLESESQFLIATKFKQALNIKEGFSTQLRVEKKSTNLRSEAEAFTNFVATTLQKSNLGKDQKAIRETWSMRDRPSSDDRVLVTSTNYPFSRDIQNMLSARIRIREYGERAKGSTDRFTSTGNGFASLEIKAKTNLPGVVVKPILKTPTNLLETIFSNRDKFRQERESILRELLKHNADNPQIVEEALAVIDTFHTASLAKNLPIECINVEYQRNAYVLEVENYETGRVHKVQITFDNIVKMREGAQATESPWQASAQKETHAYPESGSKALTVVEMKTDLELDYIYRTQPDYVRKNVPTYWAVRQEYESMQTKQADGFEADSGKAAQIKAFRLD